MTRPAPGVALLALTAIFGLIAYAYSFEPGSGLEVFLTAAVFDYVIIASGLLCLWRGLGSVDDRWVWVLVGGAMAAWGAADAYWTYALADLADPPYPSYADAGYVAVYPATYVAIVLLLRRQLSEKRGSLWLDGVISGLAIAAVTAEVVFPAVLDSLGGAPAVIATNLAYPLGDLLLIGLVAWSISVMGRRPGRQWLLLASGLLVFSISDCNYLYETARGSYVDGRAGDLGWAGGAILLAWAAWQPRRDEKRAGMASWELLAFPVFFGLMSLSLVTFGVVTHVTPLAGVLAALSLLGVIARMALTSSENLRMIAASREEARVDPLTGLGNRRRLLEDLDQHERNGGAVVLVMLDLNGFKTYNDTFGHSAGDALLSRLGGNLREFAELWNGVAYRLGGDEFCLLAPSDSQLALTAIGRGASASLAEDGEGFTVTAAYGVVQMPGHATTVTQAFRLVDERMYADKQSRRGSVVEQSTSVLVTALVERDPDLASHGGGVADLSAAVAQGLGLSGGEVEQVRLAAKLHDVGKLGVPEAILRKPGPLTDEEWGFVRQHTVIGERILLAAPALAHVAGIVRSAHERFDGNGYPDGLSGGEIPLAARIVFACDAFDAMVSQRPYADAVHVDLAVAELRACAGTQFDPDIVEALVDVITTGALSGRIVEVA